MKEKDIEKALDSIIAQLVKIRKERGISHEQMTKLTNLSRTAISYTESRKSTPSIATCLKLCDALDVKLSDLLKKDGF